MTSWPDSSDAIQRPFQRLDSAFSIFFFFHFHRVQVAFEAIYVRARIITLCMIMKSNMYTDFDEVRNELFQLYYEVYVRSMYNHQEYIHSSSIGRYISDNYSQIQLWQALDRIYNTLLERSILQSQNLLGSGVIIPGE